MAQYVKVGAAMVNPEAVDAVIPAKLPESGSRIIFRSGQNITVSDATPEQVAKVLAVEPTYRYPWGRETQINEC